MNEKEFGEMTERLSGKVKKFIKEFFEADGVNAYDSSMIEITCLGALFGDALALRAAIVDEMNLQPMDIDRQIEALRALTVERKAEYLRDGFDA